jgi:hypothetical protein
VLIRSTKRAVWSLSKPVTLAVPLDEHHELVHLAWNYVGSELAVVDSCGRIFVFQNHSSMGRMHLLRSGANDPDNELHALAALHWLPVAPYLETVRSPAAEALCLRSSLGLSGRRPSRTRRGPIRLPRACRPRARSTRKRRGRRFWP